MCLNELSEQPQGLSVMVPAGSVVVLLPLNERRINYKHSRKEKLRMCEGRTVIMIINQDRSCRVKMSCFCAIVSVAFFV